MDMVPVTHNVRHYSRIVEDKSLMRRLIQTSSDIMQRSFEGKEAVTDIVEQAEINLERELNPNVTFTLADHLQLQ